MHSDKNLPAPGQISDFEKVEMETEKEIAGENRRKKDLRKGAKVCLIVLMLYIIGQLATVFQTRHQLVSPFIPESTVWEINKQFIFTAFVAAIVNVIGLILYFFEKYLLVIVLVALTLTMGENIEFALKCRNLLHINLAWLYNNTIEPALF